MADVSAGCPTFSDFWLNAQLIDHVSVVKMTTMITAPSARRCFTPDDTFLIIFLLKITLFYLFRCRIGTKLPSSKAERAQKNGGFSLLFSMLQRQSAIIPIPLLPGNERPSSSPEQLLS
jgi:hypothetical protein